MRDWLNYRFENNSNDTFLQIKDRNFSYQEIGNIVYDRALALYDLGVIQKQKVGIFLSDPSDFIEAYLSCYKIQATSVIFNTKWNVQDLITRESTVNEIGYMLLTDYLLPFEVVSVLLLAALIGAAMLSRKKVD